MAQRIYGPVQGAGVQITEQEGQKTISPAALGWAAYVGVLERGPTNELIQVFDATDLQKKTGERFASSLLPKVCRDYFANAAGAGGLFLKRVTDGNEVQASHNIYARLATRTQIGTVKAKDGGRWGGKEARFQGVLASGAALTDTVMTTGLASTFTTDQLVGGYIKLHAVANKRYKIIGNTAAGVITVRPDQTMAADLAASGTPTVYTWYVELDNEGKEVSILFGNGEQDPAAEFSLYVFCDSILVKTFPNLSMDTASGRYWVDVINNDGGNYWVVVEDTFTGDRVAASRPANHYGVIASVAATILTATIHEFAVQSGPGNPTMTLGTTTDDMRAQTITITMTSATAGDAVSDVFGALGSIATGSLFTPVNRLAPPFTVTVGGTPMTTATVLRIRYKPFKVSELIGGYIYGDVANFPNEKFRIVANNRNTITVQDGSDLTAHSAAADEFMVFAARRLVGGRDGIADLTDSKYIQAWDQDNSLVRRAFGRGFGLIKMATPGTTSTTVQQAGRVFAARYNHQYRYECPANVTDLAVADDLFSNTLGRSDYAVGAFPSYVLMPDPDSRDGRRLTQSATGLIHGREARMAGDWDGYHKAEAGLDAALNGVLALPSGVEGVVLNEEFANPRGMAVIKKKQGTFVLWGNRTFHVNSEWMFKAQRETMSYYEQVLGESFDWIVFAINDAGGRDAVRTALIDFFTKEYQPKRALDNDLKFKDACVIKIDKENNTQATKNAGDMYCDITLAIVNCVERLKIRISKAGIFTAVV